MISPRLTAGTASSQSLWIDVLKGVAIIEIVLFHFSGDHGFSFLNSQTALQAKLGIWDYIHGLIINLTRIGSQGIHVFFFLSGFGLALSESGRRTTSSEFLRRRVGKLYPPYLIAVVLVSCAFLLLGLSELEQSYIVSFLSAVFLVQNYSSQWISAINGNWWFVAALAPMYCLHLVLRKGISEAPIRWMTTIFLVSLGYKCLVVVGISLGWLAIDAGKLNPYTAFFLNYWWEFVAGVVVFRLGIWEKLWNASSLKLWGMLFVGVAFEAAGIVLGTMAVGRVFNDDFFAVAQLLSLSCMFMLLARLAATGITIRIFGWLRLVGVSSYGLYLVHHPISRILVESGWVASSFWLLIAMFSIYFIVSWAIGALVERIGRASGLPSDNLRQQA